VDEKSYHKADGVHDVEEVDDLLGIHSQSISRSRCCLGNGMYKSLGHHEACTKRQFK
jgi:hypothetical protein